MKRLVVWPNMVARGAAVRKAAQEGSVDEEKHVTIGSQLCGEHFNEIVVKRFYQLDYEKSWARKTATTLWPTLEVK